MIKHIEIGIDGATVIVQITGKGDVYVNIAGREPVFVPGTSVLKFIQKWNEATAS